MAENSFIENADNIYFDDVEGEEGKSLSLDESLRNKFVALLQDRYASAEDARSLDEQRWITGYHNYRGMYPKNVRFRESEKSSVFVKITKTKVLAAFGQLVDVIFGANKFPIGVSETKVPEGVSEHAHLDTTNPVPGIETTAAQGGGEGEGEETEEEENPFDVGYEGDGKVLRAGATFGPGKFDTKPIEDEVRDAGMLRSGLLPTPETMELNPAQKAARRMEKLIHDQIEESNGSSEIRNALFESALFGTGLIKGPFNFNKTLNRWEENEEGERESSPVDVRVPRIEFVSIWDFFPDPNATNISEGEYIFHRH